MIAVAALMVFFVLGGISLLGILGGPLDEPRRGWVWDDSVPLPPVGRSLFGDDPEGVRPMADGKIEVDRGYSRPSWMSRREQLVMALRIAVGLSARWGD